MGQAASKVAEAAKAGAKRRTSPNVSQSIQQHRTPHNLDKTSASEPAFDRVGVVSSSRALQHQADTARRIANAASSRSDVDNNNNNSKILEMPPDLLKFLNDAGPITRTVDKQLTSARVYDIIAQDEKVLNEHARQANTRVRRRMPILSSPSSSSRNGELDDDNDDGNMTERTTNFSTTKRSANQYSNDNLDVTRDDIFDLSTKLRGMIVDTPEWKKMIGDHYNVIAKKYNSALISTTTTKGFDQLRDLTLLENSARYIGVPVLMQDIEGDIIGMWHHKVEDMKHSSGLKEVRENSIQFVMQNEGGDDAIQS